MAVEASPGSALEVVQAEFLFELLMGLLADPARLDGASQSSDRGVGRQVREIVFSFAIRAILTHQPGFLSRHVLGTGRTDSLGRAISNAYPHGGKAGCQTPLCSLAPTELPPLRAFEHRLCRVVSGVVVDFWAL